jgi:hypothetical protein
MIYKNLIAATIVVTVCIFAGSNAMAQRHGGFGGGGFSGGGFHGGSGPAKTALDTPTLWLGKSRSGWLVQAIIMARSMG